MIQQPLLVMGLFIVVVHYLCKDFDNRSLVKLLTFVLTLTIVEGFNQIHTDVSFD